MQVHRRHHYSAFIAHVENTCSKRAAQGLTYRVTDKAGPLWSLLPCTKLLCTVPKSREALATSTSFFILPKSLTDESARWLRLRARERACSRRRAAFHRRWKGLNAAWFGHRTARSSYLPLGTLRGLGEMSVAHSGRWRIERWERWRPMPTWYCRMMFRGAGSVCSRIKFEGALLCNI